jgi:23S rRNA pseudouridine955/2504/2580 synthase/23S rRNA pseudouridine1911/1915/1917 synthase
VSERTIEGRVAPEGGGKSLIDYLCERFSYLGRGQWLSSIEDGSLTLNGGRASPATLLSAGDRLRFKPPSLEEPPAPLQYGIRYEDADYLIADKPPLLPVHPSGIYFKNTLWSLLLRERPEQGTIHIVTRLDRETSGLVLVAKNAAAARHAQEAQQERSLEKRYLAVAHGAFPRGCLLAEGRLLPDEGSLVRKKRRYSGDSPAAAYGENVSGRGEGEAALERSAALGPAGKGGPQGERCATAFALYRTWQADEGPRSLIEARLITGRTHQIRATLLALGYPIVGDKLYGLDEGFFLRFIAGTLDEGDLGRLILPYQALHCSSLMFTAADGRAIRAEAPPPWLPALGIGEAELDTATRSRR